MNRTLATIVAVAIATCSATAQPLLRTHGQCWALGWTPASGGGPVVVSGTTGDAGLMSAALAAAHADQAILWYPWIAPWRPRPSSTPMSQCFAEARSTCTAQGEKVCFAYFIQFPGGGWSCNFGCSANLVCGDPPPLPPVPVNGVSADIVSALLVQEVMFALWPEG